MSLWRVFTVVTLLSSGLIQAVQGVPCLALEDCSIPCTYGLAKDANNCTICSCNDPCKGYDCGLYEICEAKVLFCTDQDPCPPRATCVPKPTGTTESPPVSTQGTTRGKDICLLGPQRGSCDTMMWFWFFNVSVPECQRFMWSGCGGNENRFNSQESCLARCLPTSVLCPDVPCASPCQLQYDSKGCSVCACPGATCRNVECSASEECQMVDGQCPTTSEDCHPVPRCLPKTEGSTTARHCPYIDCETIQCDYGFNVDQNGCKDCTCYDPCATFECPAGQMCMVRPNDCPEGSQCRDGPLRYCADQTLPPATRDRLSAEELMNCCVAANMSSSCRPLCLPDLSVTSSIISTLLQCTDELNTYLKCAGGGQSYTSCCSKKSVGSPCSAFCAGSASIDTTNLHAYTECMNNGLNDVFSCYQQGIPDTKSTLAGTFQPTTGLAGTTTPIALPNVCSQEPDMGSCDGILERWYFNPSIAMCEKFTYGGCEGNANNFLTLEDCAAACMAQACPQALCDTNCHTEMGAAGCQICVCSSPIMSSTSGMNPTSGIGPTSGMKPTSSLNPTQGPTKLSTTFPNTKTSNTRPVSLDECCSNNGVPDQCMPFCSYEFNFDLVQTDKALACAAYLTVGLTCAKRGKTYRQCCTRDGVTGQCLEACGDSSNITDITCLINDHASMLNCFAQEQYDNRCPEIDCPQFKPCPYGNLKDYFGCDTCGCYDPCGGVDCPSGQNCTYEQYPTCIGDICHFAYRGKCRGIACPPLECPNTCQYERMKNSANCEICDCYDPCSNVTCDSGHVCTVIKSMTCERGTCEPHFRAACAAQCPNVSCPACEFGFVKDGNNCSTCECFDPCKNVTCREHQTCVPVTIPTYVGEGGTQIKEVFNGECRETCELPGCNVECNFGFIKDAAGCATCICYDPCQNVTCEAGVLCRVESVNPSQNNGYNYKGVCKPDGECPLPDCHTYCPHGKIKNDKGCEICMCFEPCKNVTCADGKRCEAVEVEATKDYPYSFSGRCVPGDDCDAMPMCTMFCPNGFQKDSNGCNTCKCYEPCAGIQCEAGSVCKIEPTTEADSSIYAVKGVCRVNTCLPPACNNYCKYGFTKDSNGCQICECNDPCKNVTCDNVYICQPRRLSEAQEPPFDFIPECVQCSGMLCDINCQYGTVMLTQGCPLCECFDPCKDMTCGVNQTCQGKAVNATEDRPQSFVGECVRSHQCPVGMCSNSCQYGYTKDNQGCETCNCYDPCQETKCLTGMVCEVRLNPNCATTTCSSVAFAVCVPSTRLCAQQQKTDFNKYYPFDPNTLIPEVNCDMAGDYKPLQCLSAANCNCTTPNGLPTLSGLTRSQAVQLCFPDDKIVGVLRIHADIGTIKPGYGSYFKQNTSKQIADALGMSDSKVTITEYYSGSIVVNYVASDSNKEIMDSTWNKLQSDDAIKEISIEYGGVRYQAHMERSERIGPYYPPSTPGPGKRLTRAELLVIVIVVPVVGTLLLALLIFLCVCKLYKREKPLISDSVRSSMSFDTVMDEKGGRPKSGYENPTYDTSKVRPVSAISNGTTTA